MNYFDSKGARFLEVSRSDLAQILQGGRLGIHDLPKLTSLEINRPRPGSIYVGWNSSRPCAISIPDLIIVEQNQKDDFFAWSLSFLSSFTPLTSLTKVVDWAEYRELLKQPDREPKKYASSITALIWAELSANLGFKRNIGNLPLTAFKTTYSFAIAQAVLSGASSQSIFEITSKLNSANSILSTQKSSLGQEEITSAWIVLLAINGNDIQEHHLSTFEDLVKEVCLNLSHGIQITKNQWEKLIGEPIPPNEFKEDLIITMEERVRRFHYLAERIVQARRHASLTSFLLGCAASNVSPGETKHFELLQRFSNTYPTTLIWYALCASMYPEATILSERNYEGLRILNSVLREGNSVGSPSWDISFDELRILARNERGIFPFHQINANSVRVELMPSVVAVIRASEKSDSAQLPLFREEVPSLDEQMPQLKNLVNSLYNEIQMLHNMINQNPIKNLRSKKNK